MRTTTFRLRSRLVPLVAAVLVATVLPVNPVEVVAEVAAPGTPEAVAPGGLSAVGSGHVPSGSVVSRQADDEEGDPHGLVGASLAEFDAWVGEQVVVALEEEEAVWGESVDGIFEVDVPLGAGSVPTGGSEVALSEVEAQGEVRPWGWGRPGWMETGLGPEVFGWVQNAPSCGGVSCPLTENGYLYAGGSATGSGLRSVLVWEYNEDIATRQVSVEPPAPFALPLRIKVHAARLQVRFQHCLDGSTPPTGGNCGPGTGPKSLWFHPLVDRLSASPTWGEVDESMGPALGQDLITVPPQFGEVYPFAAGRWEKQFPMTGVVQGWVNDPGSGAGVVIRAGAETVGLKGGAWYSESAPYTSRPFLGTSYEWIAPQDAPPDMTVEVDGRSVRVTSGETTEGSWARYYNSAVVDAETDEVVLAGVAKDVGLAQDELAWDFDGLPAGEYYVITGGWNAGGGSPLAESETFTIEAPVGSSDTAGFEPWWSFEQVPLGPAGAASVNVGNGNLVVQHTDTPYVQGHGQLGYVLRRTFNSAGPETIGVIGDGLADGWSFNVTSAGDFGGGAGLVVDDDVSALLELPVTMVDRDGTRHTFVPDGLGLGVTIGVGDGTTFDLVDTIGSLLGGLLGGGENPVPDVLEDLASLAEGLLAGIPELDLPDLAVCVDTSYASPPGVHMSLWRFVAISTGGGGCANFGAGDGPGGGDPLILGYGTLTPDRVRQMFSVTGLLISQVDPAGNELRYSYDLEGPAGIRLGRLTDVWEPAACPNGPDSDPTCRALRFSYPGDDVVVTDPGGREVTYTVASDLLTDVLVRDADGTVVESWGYGYQGHDSVDCAAPTGAMCEVVSPNGATTQLSFDAEGRVTAIADRHDPADANTPSQAELTSAFTYSAGERVVERDGKARLYAGIDADLRVGELLEGTSAQVAADEGIRHTTWTWDSPEASCRPDGGVDNHLCALTRDAGTLDTTGAPAGYATSGSRSMSFTYNPEGRVLTETVDMGAAADLVTRHAYRAAYWEPGSAGDPIVVTDTLAGVHDPRPASGVLYFVSDHTATQDPNGNLHVVRSDDNYDVPPGTLGDNCGRFNRADQSITGGGNSGLVCHERAPEGYTTSYSYDGFGQRATTTAPNGGTTTYTYFDDAALDLTGQTRAGGWLRAVTDPTGEFVAFGYDRAGNVVRSWDRNATDGQPVGDFPGTLAAPPADYTETRYADGSATTAFAAPGRWPVAETDQLANLVTLTRDAHGNITNLRPPRGNEASSAVFDVTQTFSVRDELLETTTPAGTTGMRYDAWGNTVATVDGNDHATISSFDAVNRPVSMTRPRGPWADANPTEQARCRESDSGDAPIPAGRTVCTSSTAFDGLDQAYATTDPDGATAWMAFDPAGRVVDSWVPRDPGAGEWLHSRQVHDANSNVVLACPPREFDEGLGVCDPGTPARYSTATVFDGLNRPVSQTRWREAVDTANQGVVAAGWVELTTTTSYDLNAQTVTVDGPRTDVDDTVVSSYDVLDRQVSQTANRDASTVVASTWTYDPSGNIVAMGEGQAGQNPARLTAYRFDAAHRLVDTVEAATSPNAAANDNGFVATEGADPANVRTRNLYDADSNIRAVIGPRGFTASVTNPNLRFMTRTDIDEAGRMVAQWEPYWDNTVADASLNLGAFEADCPTPSTGHQPAPVAGVSAFPSTTGICVTRSSFDAAGNLTRVDNPTAVVPAQDQRFQTYRYSDDNLLAAVEGPNPAAGDVDARIDTVRVGYDASGRALFTSTPTGRITTIGGAEQRWVTETAYTPDGLPTLVEQRALTSAAAERREERSYDHAGNVVQTDTMISATRTDTTTTAWFSDGMRHQESTTVTGHNAGDVTWRWAYDPSGNTTHTWSPSAVAGAANNTAGEPTTMAYTPDGLASEMVEPVLADGTQHRQTSFGHDILGRVILEEVALVGTGAASSPAKAYTWTTLGQRATEVGRDGTVQSFTYNAASQLTGAVEDGFNRSVSAGYYLNGWLRSTGSAVAGSPAQSRHQKFFYWGDGLEGWRFFGSDPTHAQPENIQGFIYNDARAMTEVGALGWGFGGTQDQWTITNDRAGRPLTMTDPPNGGAPARTTTFDRNPDGTIAERTLHSGAAGTSVIDEWAYTYDATGRVASRNRTGSAGTLNEVLGYDEAGRLSTINSNAVSYDPNGNRLSGPGMPTQTFRADNAIATGPGATGGSEAYQYTPWGGVTRDACKTYNYDGFDRAHRTNIRKTLDLLPRCDALGDLLTANDQKRYDPLGRNVWARHDRVFVLGEPTLTEYQNLYPVGLGQTVAYEHTVGDADRSGRYVNTPDGTPLAVTDLNGDYQFLHRDGQGNTVAAINPGGSVACGPELDPWGEGADECDNLLTPATPNRRWYNSSRLDTTTETYQWGTRTYNPETATWQQPDTAALTGAPDNVSIGTDPLVANRYSYVNGDPINHTDPSGHIMIEGNESRPGGAVKRTSGGQAYLASSSGGTPPPTPPHDPPQASEELDEGYSLRWKILEGDYQDALDVMSALKDDPNAFFPFAVVPVHCGPKTGMDRNDCGVELGAELSLEGSNYKPGNVYVISESDTNFTFVALPGHIGQGGTISFSTYVDDGWVYLQQDAMVDPNSIEGLGPDIFTESAGRLTWSQMTASFLHPLFNDYACEEYGYGCDLGSR